MQKNDILRSKQTKEQTKVKFHQLSLFQDGHPTYYLFFSCARMWQNATGSAKSTHAKTILYQHYYSFTMVCRFVFHSPSLFGLQVLAWYYLYIGSSLCSIDMLSIILLHLVYKFLYPLLDLNNFLEALFSTIYLILFSQVCVLKQFFYPFTDKQTLTVKNG